MNLPKNNSELIKKEEIKYLPCIRLIELYDNCTKIKENNFNYQRDKCNYQKDKCNYQKDKCNYLLISAVMKCGIS